MNEKNELVKFDSKGGAIVLNSEDNVKIITSLDIENEDHIDLILASQDNEQVKYIKDYVGDVIKCIGVYIRKKEFEEVNEDGEIVKRNNYTTLLFDIDKNIYVTGSNSFYRSLNLICTLKGFPTENTPLKIKIGEVNAEIAGHKWLKALLVK